MNKFLTALLLSATLALQGCASFKAERLSTAEGDEKAMEITDEWLLTDTQNTVGEIMKKMEISRFHCGSAVANPASGIKGTA